MTVAPVPMFPEKGTPVFERSFAPSIPGNRGPLRFEEGVATDTDVPYDFGVGAYEDTAPSPMRMNHNNPEMFYKYAEETMRERAHVGSASWIEAPTVLGEFVQGSMAGDMMPQFEYSYNTGGHMNRPNPTVVYD
jgi:hypothetical protein